MVQKRFGMLIDWKRVDVLCSGQYLLVYGLVQSSLTREQRGLIVKMKPLA